MKAILVSSMCAVLLVAPTAFGAEGVKDVEKVVVEGKKVVELADGGSIIIDKEGRTYHVEANGRRSLMKDGVVMVGKDGMKYLHKNDIMWKPITEKGTRR